MADTPTIRDLKHLDAVQNLLEPEERALLASRGIEISAERPPKPYQWAELVSILVYGSNDIMRHPLGALIFARYDDARAAVEDPALGAMGSSGVLLSGITSGPLYDLFSSLMFSHDGETHERLRSTVMPWFMPKAVQSCRPAIEAYARRLLEPLIARRGGDLVSEFADPLALAAGLIRLGAPVEAVPRLRDSTLALFRAFFPMTPEQVSEAERAAGILGDFADELIAARRRAPADDLVTHLIGCVDAGQLSASESRSMVMNLLFGGHDLTKAAIANAFFTLFQFPVEWQRLVADPSLARTAAEECLRYQPPGGAVGRLARSPTTIRGCPIPEGTVVFAGGVAANRDPVHVERPHVFDVGRTRSKLFTFGAGDHYCLGANLARLTLEIALTACATTTPSLRLACALDEVSWDSPMGAPVLAALPVVIGAPRAAAR